MAEEKHSKSSAIAVALIGAIASVAVAWITAVNRTNDTIQNEDTKLSELINKISELEKKEHSNCLSSLSRSNFREVKTFYKFTQSNQNPRVDLVDIGGKGCLIGGTIQGYYVKDEPNGTNHTIKITVDGDTFTYPPKDSQTGKATQAYAQNANSKNISNIVLPTVEYKESLKISYYYWRDDEYIKDRKQGKQVAAYALVLPKR